MIEARELTKRYGPTPVVDALTFQARPGSVTGILGPNGSGKSTTLRMILGLCTPDAGEALVDGRRYNRITRPMTTVGALLDAGAAYGGRTARTHLRCLARSNGIGADRVTEVLALVGLEDAAERRIAGFSLGMRQRLGIAAALLGDPPALIVDEPANGLDPNGIRWFRTLARGLAAEGRTILISSHQIDEMERIADHLIIIGRGRLLADATPRVLAASYGGGDLEEAYHRLVAESVEFAGRGSGRAVVEADRERGESGAGAVLPANPSDRDRGTIR